MARHREQGRQIVVVQGLAFVGSAVAAVIAAARESAGQPLYFVIGVDLASPSGYCLTKDSLLAQWSAINWANQEERLYMTLEALRINHRMPLHTLDLLKELVEGHRNYREAHADRRISAQPIEKRGGRASLWPSSRW